MYKIRGADQKEYGPVSVEVLRQWIAQGRVNAQTQIQQEGTVEWKPLGAFPELSGLLAPLLAPPLMRDTPVPGGPAKTSGLAIASLVLGILGLCSVGVTALVGLVLGIVALVKIDNSKGRMGGRGVAIAGICVSGVFLLFIPVQAGLLLPALAKAKAKAQTINCVSNLKQVGLALRMYANDNKDTLPAATNWCDAIQSYVVSSKPFVCPAGQQDPRCGYAFNSALSNVSLDKVHPGTVMVFESKGGWNDNGRVEAMISRHQRTYVVGFADGSVMQVSVARLGDLRWEP